MALGGITWIEAQSWWSGPVGGGEPESVPFPYRHIHLSVGIPTGPVSGIVEVPFKAFTHNQVGTLKSVKWQDDKGGSAQTIIIKPNVVIGPGDVYEGSFLIDTSKEVNSGLRLWRFYATWLHANGNTHVARPRFIVWVENGKPLKNVAVTDESPTGWYKEVGPIVDWGYVHAGISYGDRLALGEPKSGSWTPTIKTAHNGGPAIVQTLVHLDPSFHVGDIGTVVLDFPGEFDGPLAIDVSALAPGTHRLVIRTVQEMDGKHHEGVGAYDFIVG